MKSQNVFARMSRDELAQSLQRYAAAQHDMAAKTSEDMTFWHYFALASLLEEAAERIATVKSP